MLASIYGFMHYGFHNVGPPADLSPEQTEEAAAERLAKEADGILKRLERARAKSWDDWMAIADRLAGISLAAMRLSGANMRGGRGYNEMMAHLLRKHSLGDPKWKQTRAALLNIHEHRGDVEAMRAKWDHDQQLKWQAPTTVWDKFSHRQKADDPRPRGQSSNRSQILIALQEENDRLKRENEQLQARLRNFFDGLDAADVVTLLVEHYDEEAREKITVGLQESRGIPPGSLGHSDDGWPVTAERDEDGGEDDR
jgi:hypothetical protein